MDETIYVIFQVQFDFALEVWFSILDLLAPEVIKLFMFNSAEYEIYPAHKY